MPIQIIKPVCGLNMMSLRLYISYFVICFFVIVVIIGITEFYGVPTPKIEILIFKSNHSRVYKDRTLLTTESPANVSQQNNCCLKYTNGNWVKVQAYSKPYIWYDLNCCRPTGLKLFQQFPYQRAMYTWKVEDNSCNSINYTGSFILSKLKNSWTTFIGDSLNRNQYVSLICILQNEIFVDQNKNEIFDHIRYFPAYNATVACAWSTFLVRPTFYTRLAIPRHPDPTLNGPVLDKTLFLALTNSTNVVLNTGGWWESMERRAIFLNSTQRLLKVLVDYNHVNFFFNYEGFKHASCGKDKSLLSKQDVLHDKTIYKALQDIQKLKKKFINVKFLQTIQLSHQRVDAHPGGKDCQHWMLPGVPDTWNLILFNYLW